MISESYKILLLGGTGTLSTAVLNSAIKNGYNVSVFNRGHNNSLLPHEVEILKGDFKAEGGLSILKDRYFDVIVDFLSRVPADINRVYGTLGNNCRQYIFISSACVYRRERNDFPIVESSPKPNPDWNYNVEKYECELLLKEFSKKVSSYYTIVRPYITYDDQRIPLGIAPAYKYHKTIIERIKSGKPMLVWDEGHAITTVTHTEDFAKALTGLFLNEKARNEDFHITSSFQYTVKDVLLALYEILGCPPNIISVSTDQLCKLLPRYASMLKGDRSLDAIFNNKKIKDAVPNLSFDINLFEGLKRNYAYYKNVIEYEYDYEFDAQMDRVAKSFGVHTSYINYSNDSKSHRIVYLLFKYLPYKLARKVCRILKLR